MHKIAAIMLTLAAILFAAGPAMAEIDSTSDSTSESNATINLDASEVDNSRSLPMVLTPTKLDGSFVAPPSAYYDPRNGGPELPEIYKLEGWGILDSEPYNKGIPIKRVKLERKSWISQQVSITGEKVDQGARAIEDGDILITLPYYPEGVKEVAVCKTSLQNESYTVNQALAEALFQCQKASGAAYYVVLSNMRLVSKAKVRAFGSALVTGVAVDPHSISNTSINALSGGGGVGIGSAQTFVFREPSFMVIAFSNKGEIPQRFLKKVEPQKIESPKEILPKPEIIPEPKESPKAETKEEHKPEAKADPKIEAKEEIAYPMVEFEFDKFKLVTEAQKKPVRAAAEKTAQNWEKMKKENMQIFIVGSCSPEGTANYNDVLGRKRAEEIYKLFSTILIDVYGLPDEEVKERVKFLSAGKNNYPEFAEIAKQRNAAFFIAAKMKVKKD